jgi:hypothetical protein
MFTTAYIGEKGPFSRRQHRLKRSQALLEPVISRPVYLGKCGLYTPLLNLPYKTRLFGPRKKLGYVHTPPFIEGVGVYKTLDPISQTPKTPEMKEDDQLDFLNPSKAAEVAAIARGIGLRKPRIRGSGVCDPALRKDRLFCRAYQ